MDLITKYKNKIAELQKKQKTFESTGRAGGCISLQGEIQAYNAVICDLVRDGYKPDSEDGKLPIPHVVQQSEQLCQYEPDNTTAMNCKHCGEPKWVHQCCSLA